MDQNANEKCSSLRADVSDLFVDWLSARIKGGMPSNESRTRFAPALSYGRHFGPAPATARDAAVIILLYQADGEWRIPLTLRPETYLHRITGEQVIRALLDEVPVPATAVMPEFQGQSAS